MTRAGIRLASPVMRALLIDGRCFAPRARALSRLRVSDLAFCTPQRLIDYTDDEWRVRVTHYPSRPQEGK